MASLILGVLMQPAATNTPFRFWSVNAAVRKPFADECLEPGNLRFFQRMEDLATNDDAARRHRAKCLERCATSIGRFRLGSGDIEY